MTDAAEAGMVHLRLIAGAEEAPHVLRVLENSPAVASLVRIADSSVRPPGDLILCDVAREEVSVVVSQLRRAGLGPGGSISIDVSGWIQQLTQLVRVDHAADGLHHAIRDVQREHVHHVPIAVTRDCAGLPARRYHSAAGPGVSAQYMAAVSPR